MYSSLYTQPKQSRARYVVLPLVALVAVGLLVYNFAIRQSPSSTQASGVDLVAQTVVNVSDTDATVYWEFGSPQSSWLLWGDDENNLNKTAYDTGNNPTTAQYHKATLSGLQPGQRYMYRIMTDSGYVTEGEEGIFIFTTKTKAETPSGQPIYGKVILPNGSPAADSIVRIDDLKLLTTSRSSGEWLMTLPAFVSPSQSITLKITHEGQKPSTVKTVVNRASPLPQSVVLGSDYTYVDEGDNVLPASTERTEGQYVVQILYPKDDAVIPGARPLIKGNGVPKAEVLLAITQLAKSIYQSKTYVNTTGDWSFLVPFALKPGRYDMSVKTKDTQDVLRTLERTFVIAKSGEQVLGEETTQVAATPSATLIPSPTVMTAISPTVMITSGPTISAPSPTPSVLMETGSTDVTMPLFVSGVLLMVLGAGIVLVRKSE